MRAKQGRVVGKGESQRSNVLSGMPKKARLLVSDLIKTHRIIAIFKPERWNEVWWWLEQISDTQVPLYANLLPTSKPWYPIKQIHAHFANCSNIPVAYFLPFLSQCAWQQVTGLNRICIWNQREHERNFWQGRWHEDCNRREGGGKWKALHLTLKAELRGGRWQARLKRDFKRLRWVD